MPVLPKGSDFITPNLGLIGRVDLIGGFLKADGTFSIGVFLGVVLLVFSRGIPRSPSARISRSTVHRATVMPSRLSSAWIFRAP